ncbi:hypothetical protein BJ085DRAFT_13627 [Dimargaris cristalligena]|uniref:Uncharacterized protein n=1 Tax=Dimargaris cristalligena TaxID=215637 RepID=A0A4Q0A2H9_9FUNG|nr:hypothetical protein BJ085DRAFT_13627 [Dimargaris cristalligena]|eukprot:RKP39721.1 hypothetical protein BJ085DRAFT_13627 [Dimargaris cristalligena]
MSKDRTFPVMVLFTAYGGSFPCNPCEAFAPEYQVVADSWRRLAPAAEKDRLFFMVATVENTRSAFERLGVQSVPVPYHFPPNSGSQAKGNANKPQSVDLNKVGLQAESLVKFMNQKLGYTFKTYRPINWRRLSIIGLVVSFVITVAVILLPRLSWRSFSFKGLGSSVVIVVTLMMCSGFMFVRIKGIPYMIAGRSGQPEFIAGQFQHQWGIETQIVASVYALCGACIVALVHRIPKIDNQIRQSVTAVVVMALFMAAYSAMMAFLRIKNPAYPYRLLF